MENLHLKNLNQPNGEKIFYELYELKENYNPLLIEQNINNNLKRSIIQYITSKRIKNPELQDFIHQFAKDLINNDIEEEINIAYYIMIYLEYSKITTIDINKDIQVCSTLLVSSLKNKKEVSFKKTKPIKFKNSFKYIFKLKYNNISKYSKELKITLYSDEEKDLFKVIKIDNIKFVKEY